MHDQFFYFEREKKMSIGAMSILLPLAVLLLAIGWGFLIGMRRTRARFFVVLLCLVVAIAATVWVKGVSYQDLSGQISQRVAESDSEMLNDLWSMVESSKVMQEAAVSGGTAILAPTVFAAVFVAASLASWVVCYIVFLVLAILRALSGKRRRRARPVRTIVYAALQWIVTLFVLVTPFACYFSTLPDLVDVAVDMGLFEEQDGGAASANAGEIAQAPSAPLLAVDASQNGTDNPLSITAAEAKEAAKELAELPLLKFYQALGGKQIVSSMTSFHVNGQETTLGKELTALTKFSLQLLSLSKNEIKNYGAEEAETIRGISESFEDSLLLPSVGGEVIWYATDAWEAGNTFMGVSKPDLGKDETTKMFAEAFDHILEVLQSDARKTENLCEDFNTLAGLIEIMARDGVFQTMQESNTDAIIDKLSGGTTIADMISALHSNARFSILVTDITNIGMRFIAEALQLPENSEEIYHNFTNEIADAVNQIKQEGKTAAELADDLRTALDNSGVEIDTDITVLELYATALLEDYEDVETVTAEDIEQFFKAFETVTPGESDTNESASTNGGKLTQLSASQNENSGKYAGMTDEERRNNTVMGITAQFLTSLQELAKQEGMTQEEFVTAAKAEMERLLNASTKYSGSNGDRLRAALMQIIEKMKQEALSGNLLQSASALGSASSLPSLLVTIDDLLSSSEDSDQPLTEEQKKKDAEAIQNIFGKAATIKKSLENSNEDSNSGLGNVSGAVNDLGSVLDELSDLSSVGSQKTNQLATAVMQSKTVRESTGLTPKEATELVNKMTESNEDGSKPKFEDTMASLSNGADIIAKLNNNESVTEEEIHELLENMTPQTASALETLINEARMESFGIKDSEKQTISAELIRSLLAEMGDRKTYEGRYEQETGGVAKLFDLAIAASKQEGKTHLFRQNDSDDDSVLGGADEVVSAILGSEMVCRAIDKTLHHGTDASRWNPFGLKSADSGSADYLACEAAILAYANAHPNLNPDYVRSIGALFGIAIEI